MVAGISALAISALSVSGLVSAANTSSNTTTSSTTKSQSFKWMMKWGMKDGKMEKWNFWPGRGQGFGWEHGGKWMFRWMQNPALKAAIDANDYTAFIAARKADTNKPSDATQPTQEQFNQIVAHYKTRTAIDAAITAKDYNAFIIALKSNTNRPSDARIPTQDEFTKMIARATQSHTQN